MKTMAKFFVGVVLAALVLGACGVCTSCASSSSSGEVMYQHNHNKKKVIKSNYKVKGSNRTNSNTYHAY